jgi:hypothetical protein
MLIFTFCSDLLSVILDFLRIPLLVLILVEDGNLEKLLLWFSIIYILRIFLLTLMSSWSLRDRPDLQTSILFIVSYPFFEVLLGLFQMMAGLYNVVYLIPRREGKTKIKNVLRMPAFIEDDHIVVITLKDLKEQRRQFKKENPDKYGSLPKKDRAGVALPPVSQGVIDAYAKQSRLVPIRGAVRVVSEKGPGRWIVYQWLSDGTARWRYEMDMLDEQVLNISQKVPHDHFFLLFLVMLILMVSGAWLASLEYDLFLLLTFIFFFYIAVAISLRAAFAEW